MTSFGRVTAEADEPWFHEEWERRAFAVTLAMGATGTWTLDASRHARETLPPFTYWSKSYYEIWFEGLIKLLQANGLANASEIADGKSRNQPKSLKRVLAADQVMATLAKGAPTSRDLSTPAKFAVGHRVTVRNLQPETHIRLPAYVRGRRGTVTHVHGAHVFPDANAHEQGENPQWLYNVCFTGEELWGRKGHTSVCVDLWEPYLA